MAGPLDGYRIIDLTQVVSGPLATMVLCDQGADVIKIEPVKGGDLTRITGVPVGGIVPFFANHNRGKRSVAVDVQTDEGRELVLHPVQPGDPVPRRPSHDRRRQVDGVDRGASGDGGVART